ncbi:hypothetical protein EVAR_22424_1 [Eumeta japonica]|uniref:Uncharacterized protein n=1 Tax=Eumeta variegata TaxID=151549 RepID=A0A4C1ZVN5_EUMVA|nr:hypothetical protein EVAR_22424_1 [Eumeta japonica]
MFQPCDSKRPCVMLRPPIQARSVTSDLRPQPWVVVELSRKLGRLLKKFFKNNTSQSPSAGQNLSSLYVATTTRTQCSRLQADRAFSREEKPKNSVEYLSWKDDHNEENCMKTQEDSAGSMEVEYVKVMFLRSEEQHGVKYG